MSFKTLISQDQLNNAKLYSTKFEFIKHLPKNAHILEIGTLAGDYAELLLETNPASIDLVDVFKANDWRDLNRFDKAGHYNFVKNRFKDNPEVSLLRGYSHDVLPTLTKKYDYIYIDANHDYEHASQDLADSLPLLAEGGIIGLNDYIYDDADYIVYGVIETVCEFLDKNRDWEVIGFALQERMYADIYIKKVS
jgi:predicted O-methyltransferase YrrM